MSQNRVADFLMWLRSIEEKWQKIWKERRLWEADPDPSKPKFFITVPYPYSNGPLHIGHGRTYTIGDIVARYKRLKGFNVLYPMAFHITGTPIIAISEMISRGDKKTLDAYRKYVGYYISDPAEVEKIVESFKDPLSLATFFAEKIQSDFEAIGYSIDWRRKFHTGEPFYQKFIEWQYIKLSEKGVVTRGDHIVTYCLLHRQPEGEDDIQDADVNPVEILEYVAVKFKLVDSDVYLLAATLRPETLFGVTNVWVNPETTYTLIRFRNEKLVVSEKAAIKLQHQYPEEEVEILGKIEGRDLVGKKASSPLGQEVIILPANFPDPDNATGIVYSEPSDAPYDYVALMDLKRNPEKLAIYGLDPRLVEKIEPIKIIEVPGVEGHHAQVIVEKMGIVNQLDPRLEDVTRDVYKDQFYNGVLIVENPEYKGLRVPEAREKMKKWLLDTGGGLKIYELNRKAYCRAGGEIIVAKIKGQWFLDYSSPELKSKAKDFIENKLVVVPSKYKKAFVDTIEWLEKRPCARRRGIGTRLPWDKEWIIESLSDSTIYMAFYAISHILREVVSNPEQLKPELFDYVFTGVGDVYKVSEATGIPPEKIEAMRKEFEYWYPVDQRHTGIPHISNHLTFYILHHLILFPEDKWPKKISLNETVIREGAKMSKSKGNVIPLRDIAKIYSADLFRLYISWGASLDSVLDWREKDVEMVVDSLRKFVELARKASISKCEETLEDALHLKWFKGKFLMEIREAEKAIEEMDIREYVQRAFFNILNLVDKLRDFADSEDEINCSVKAILSTWITALNPVIPHITEEINEWLGPRPMLALSKWPEASAEPYEETVILLENIESVVRDIREIKALVKKSVKKAYIIVAPEWKRIIAEMTLKGEDIRNILEYAKSRLGLRGKELEVVEVVDKFKTQPDQRILKTRSLAEYEAYVAMRKYLEKKTGLEIEVVWEDEAKQRNIRRAEKSLPLKPALYLE